MYTKNGHFPINILDFIAYLVFIARTEGLVSPYDEHQICNKIQNIYGKVAIFGIYDRYLVYYKIS